MSPQVDAFASGERECGPSTQTPWRFRNNDDFLMQSRNFRGAEMNMEGVSPSTGNRIMRNQEAATVKATNHFRQNGRLAAKDLLRKTASGRTPVAFYLRTGPAGPEAEALLVKQRNAIQRANISDKVLAEFTETETAGSTERPQLVKVLELCREHLALLFIGTTDAIEGGEEFQPEFTDVPYEVAYRRGS